MAGQILIDERDAAKLLSMPPARLKRMAKRNEVPHVLLPDGEIRFCAADLEEWTANFKIQPHAAAQRTRQDPDAAAETDPPPRSGARRRARG